MEPESQPSNAELAAKIDGMIFAFKLMASILIVFISIPNFLAALTIGHFAEIFRDVLPGKPLPLLTVGIIYLRSFLPFLALAWPIVSTISIWKNKSLAQCTVVPTVIAVLIGSQFLLTWIGCFLPMVNLMVGMSDMNAH